MKSYYLLILIFFFCFKLHAFSLQNYSANPYGKILFMRHALAPGFGDPDKFILKKCETQRNLNNKGRKQALFLGKKLKSYNIYFDKVYSSQWCRCLETANLLKMGEVIQEKGLNSFFQNYISKEKTINRLKEFLNEILKKEERVLLVTHYVNIMHVTGMGIGSGEILVYDIKTKKSVKLEI